MSAKAPRPRMPVLWIALLGSGLTGATSPAYPPSTPPYSPPQCLDDLFHTTQNSAMSGPGTGEWAGLPTALELSFQTGDAGAVRVLAGLSRVQHSLSSQNTAFRILCDGKGSWLSGDPGPHQHSALCAPLIRWPSRPKPLSRAPERSLSTPAGLPRRS